MMKSLNNWEDLVGRTPRAAFIINGLRCLVFDDAIAAIKSSSDEWSPAPQLALLEIDMPQHIQPLLEHGIITEQEAAHYRSGYADLAERRRVATERHEREQLAQLKAKYPESAP